jgi:thioredoxin 1
MMAPIIEELTKEYSGRLNVVFVNADKEQALTERYGVDLIPVQIFYDAQGKEIFRHVGFFPKDQIQAKLSQMGVK